MSEQNESSKNHSEKILTIQKGQELRISVSDDIRSPMSFMYAAYCQALCAVLCIDEQSQQFHAMQKHESDKTLMDDLFQYGGNIIAFEGVRGSGKTSTMLSFARLLGEGEFFLPVSLSQKQNAPMDFLSAKQIKRLSEIHFIPLSPIAPSILEEKQSILTVILSRMYSYISDRLNDDYSVSLHRKQEIAMLFQKCLSGLRGIRRQVNDAQEDFAMLQDVSDGMSLRTSFYRLVQNILKADRKNGDWQNTYLVLQLDDADSQLKVSYDVLEDLRKYLMLPNVIILTSADFSMLRRVVLQRYLSELAALPNSEKDFSLLQRDLAKAANKYIDKLIPPTNLICLPRLESTLVRWGSRLKLRYGTEEEIKKGGSCPSLQDELLNSIYRKTGIIFTSTSAAGPHAIIPTTLRGINQLLYLLEGMKNLPPFIPDETALSRALPVGEFLDKLAAYIEREYLPTLDDNLQRFTDYFVQDWINVRILNQADRDFLVRMEHSATDKVRLVCDYLNQKYTPPITSTGNVAVLCKHIRMLEKKCYQREDLSFFSAIKVLITLENHTWVLRRKRAAIHEFYAKNQTAAFNTDYFTSDPNNSLPREYFVTPEDWKVDDVYSVFNVFKKIDALCKSPDPDRQKRYRLFLNCMISPKRKNQSGQFSLINIVTFFLQISEFRELFDIIPDDVKSIKRYLDIYDAQELSLRIAANWDVWEGLSQSKLESRTETESMPGASQLNTMFRAIDAVLMDEIGTTFFNEVGIDTSWNAIHKILKMDVAAIWNFIRTKGRVPLCRDQYDFPSASPKKGLASDARQEVRSPANLVKKVKLESDQMDNTRNNIRTGEPT